MPGADTPLQRLSSWFERGAGEASTCQLGREREHKELPGPQKAEGQIAPLGRARVLLPLGGCQPQVVTGAAQRAVRKCKALLHRQQQQRRWHSTGLTAQHPTVQYRAVRRAMLCSALLYSTAPWSTGIAAQHSEVLSKAPLAKGS